MLIGTGIPDKFTSDSAAKRACRRKMVRVDGVRALLRVRVALPVLRVCGGAAAAFQYTRVVFSAATYSSSTARSFNGSARMQHQVCRQSQSF